MVRERISREEYKVTNSESESSESKEIPADALTEEERDEINGLFDLLNERGYLTAGPYQITADENRNKSVSVTVILPSTISKNDV